MKQASEKCTWRGFFAYKNCGGITGVVFFSSSGKQITDVNCNLREDGDLQS